MRALILIVLASLVLAGCTGDKPPASSTNPATKSNCDGVSHAALDVSNHSNTVALIDTDKGCIVAELYDSKAPITVANFKKLAESGFYKDLLFHRIIKTFMVQTGGMQTDGEFKESPYGPIKNEAKTSGLKNTKYTLSMARTSAPDSATNQFFINTGDNTNLDPSANSDGYAVFGKVVKGMDVVDAIAAAPVTMYNAPGANPHCQPEGSPSCPKEDIVLRQMTMLKM